MPQTPDNDVLREQLEELVELYKQGKPQETLQRGDALATQYPEVAFIPNLLGVVSTDLGHLEQAVACFSKAIRLKPDYSEALTNLGNVQYDLGRLKDAVASYEKALQLEPDYAEAHTNLGNAQNDLGRHQEAACSYQKAVQLEPGDAATHNSLGIVLHLLGKHEDAIASFQTALRLVPDYAEAYTNLGIALSDLGKPDAAVASHRKALQLKPDHAKALNNLGIALNDLGETEAAVASYEKALQLVPDRAKWHRNLSTAKRYQHGDAHIDQMLQLIERSDLSNNDRLNLSFALGKAFGDTGAHETAISYLLEGNRLRKEELKYEISSDRALFAKIKSTFSLGAPLLDRAKEPTGGAHPRPVFILGMPRSGTTLVEQILSSHSEVYGAGEMKLLGQSVNSIKWDAAQLSISQLRTIRESYLSGLSTIGAPEPWVTDKMPRNFLWIGFILAALPEAKIVHVIRDARATCWSNFKHFFPSKGYGFSHDLRDLAEYYKMYADLMAFWHERFPGRIYDLNYEALTEQQEDQTRKLLDHVGLGWEDQCLAFHTTERAVRTASAQQVRQKMYQGSSDEWRKYEKHLGPMLELLKGY